MGSLSIWHWLIVLVVVVLIFGTKKLRNLGTDLGGVVIERIVESDRVLSPAQQARLIEIADNVQVKVIKATLSDVRSKSADKE